MNCYNVECLLDQGHEGECESYQRPTRRANARIARANSLLTPMCEAPGCHVTSKTTVRVEDGELQDMCIRHFLEFGESTREAVLE